MAIIKVGIADDHAVVRQGLKQIVSDIDDIEITDEAQNGQEVLEKIKKN